MSKNDEKKDIIVHSASELTLNFPQAGALIDGKDAEKVRAVIRRHGAFSPDGSTYVATDALPNLLVTDQKGAKRVFLDMSDEDKLNNGNKSYASVPAVQKAISSRIEEPRDAYVRERLKENERLLITLRDAPELEKARSVAESKNRDGQSKLKKKKIDAEGISACQLTGDPLEEDAHAHHMNRKADFPRETLDLSNIAIVNKMPHMKIHRAGAETKEELSELCKKEGWNDPTVG